MNNNTSESKSNSEPPSSGNQIIVNEDTSNQCAHNSLKRIGSDKGNNSYHECEQCSEIVIDTSPSQPTNPPNSPTEPRNDLLKTLQLDTDNPKKGKSLISTYRQAYQKIGKRIFEIINRKT